MARDVFNIELPKHELDKLFKDLNKYSEHKQRQIGIELDAAAANILVDAQNNLDRNKSRKTSVLRTSGKYKTNFKKLIAEVSFNVYYAIFVEKGTRPHVIRAKNKKVLGNKKVGFFGKQVNHPGSRAKPYLEPAAISNLPKLTQRIKKLLDKK